ncbi:hypothetical protein [Actinomyces sp. MRS3W]|uniref:hypothetical protein n=1 Tax=Actinomyces sp. MRS3W TaxID=2800796 RepID=UPI0028FD0D1B|nr:hypothetical protein [Actinomyces sp. MRS3W]MDU0347626.1 hypothetical protein [Actinomyces sp. MRS3W]
MRIARLLDGRGFVRIFFLLYGAALITSVIAVSAVFMDDYDDSAIFIQHIISHNFVLIGSCWSASSGLTIIAAALCVGGSTLIRIKIQKYFQALAQFTAYSGLVGSIAGAFIPLIAMVMDNLNTLRSVTPTLLLNTAAIGATTGFVLGLPLCLPQLIDTRNALYKAAPAPLAFIIISTALKKVNITPLLIESTLVQHMTANGVRIPKLSEVETLSTRELLADWPSFMALEDSLGNPAIISDTYYMRLSVAVALASIVYAFASCVRANKLHNYTKTDRQSTMAPSAAASTNSAGAPANPTQ